jgi:hypothetical protein
MYSIVTDVIENIVPKNAIDFCVRNRYRENVFVRPLPCNGQCNNITVLK